MSGLAEVALWALVALPAAVGGLMTLSAGARRIAAPVSLITAGVTAALSLFVAVARPSVVVPFMAGADFGMEVDMLGALVAPTVAVITLLVLTFASGEIRESQHRFHGLMLLFASAALLTTTATTLLTVLFAWEIMGGTSYALVAFWWRDNHRVSAGLTAFITTRTADLGLYVAVAAALAGGAGMAFADLPASSSGWRDVIAAGVLVSALGKAAQLPFSFWLSGAMAGPSPVSALLHSAAMVAMGGFLVLRAEPLLVSTGWAGPTTAWAGAATAVVLGLVAVAQRDLKQLLAASTSAQLGFVFMGAGAASVAGGTSQLIAHAATKSLLFLVAGAWLTALGTKQLAGLQGVARRWQAVGWAATVGALSLAGLAPFSLWATKDAVLAAALEQSPWLYAAGLGGAALSAAYSGKILWITWRRVSGAEVDSVRQHENEEELGTGEVNGLQKVPMVILAAAASVLGVLALPPLYGSIGSALGAAETPESNLVELGASAAIAVSVLLVVARRNVPEPRWALDWLGMERLAHALVVRPTLRLAEALTRFDDRVLDRGVDATSFLVLRLASRSTRADDRYVDGAAEWVAAQARALGRIARRPQTGQLYQYYLQAVAIIGVGLGLLVMVR